MLLFSLTDRYLIRELVFTFLATVIVLLLMVLSHRLGVYLSQAASGLLAQGSILLLLGLQALRYLVILLPLAGLIATMLTLGRLYQDNEMTALQASGLGPVALYRPLLLLAVPLALVLLGLALFVTPRTLALQTELQEQARQDAEISMFAPGVFREVADGQVVIYVGEISEEDTQLQDIFIYNLSRYGMAITTAEQGFQRIETDTGARYVILREGRRYEGMPGEGDYQSVEFDELEVRVDLLPEEDRIRHQSLSTAALLTDASPEAWAEFHQRLSGSISVLILALLAPLLAHASPRSGRYGRVVAAVLIYAIYVNLLGLGQVWLVKGDVWSALGLWWVHGLMATTAVALGLYRYGLPWR